MANKKRIVDGTATTHTAAHVETEIASINYDLKHIDLIVGAHHTREAKIAGANRIGPPVNVRLDKAKIKQINTIHPGFIAALRNVQEGLDKAIPYLDLGWMGEQLSGATEVEDVDNDWSPEPEEEESPEEEPEPEE